MNHLSIYNGSLALLTDLYQLTMAQGYWKQDMVGTDAIFHLFFREAPFNGGYAVAAGLKTAVDLLLEYEFSPEDLAYLGELRGSDDEPLFDEEFLDFLARMEFSCSVDAVPEGNIVFPHEPLVRVEGPLIQAQLLESVLLNIINFQTLIATKASRVCYAAGDEPVLEFGLRRAQGLDGALSASRAAVIGGCAATSNVLAGKLFGIPVKGTHAHSWVMSFDSELEAFEAYAESMPNNVVFLVDTYDTIRGVKNAITVGRKLRDKGYEMAGIRLDSGDLAWLSIEARKMLDEAGFEKTKIVASNNLDERTIRSLKEQGAQIAVWGVGTHLATAKDQPALGGVYKMSAVRSAGGDWEHKVKLSEQRIKISNPGKIQVRRFWKNKPSGIGGAGEFVGDMIYDELTGEPPSLIIVDPLDETRRKRLEGAPVDLLKPIFKEGHYVGEDYIADDIMEIQQHSRHMLARFHDGIKRFDNPHEYPAGLEMNLYELKKRLILEARGFDPDEEPTW
ncbi:MAG: nicotinate phosphoribosyltransferase [Persicimonas sp.]